LPPAPAAETPTLNSVPLVAVAPQFAVSAPSARYVFPPSETTLNSVGPTALRNAPSVMLPVPEQSERSAESWDGTLNATTPVDDVRVRLTGTVTHGVAGQIVVALDTPAISVGASEKLAAIVWFALTELNVYEVIDPCETPSTSTSATWYPIAGVIV